MTLNGRMTVTTAVACALVSSVLLPLFTNTLPGLRLMAAGAVGITAVLADLSAVRLRSTAVAGLPLLVLFTVTVTMNASHSQLATGVVFCLSGAGYLAMLSADGRERIRVWGRLVSLWRAAPRYGQVSGGTGFDG